MENAGSLLEAPGTAEIGETVQTIDVPAAENAYLASSVVSSREEKAVQMNEAPATDNAYLASSLVFSPDEETAETIDAAIVDDTYPASGLLSAPLPAVALFPSTSSFLSASNLGSIPNNQNGKQIHSYSSPYDLDLTIA